MRIRSLAFPRMHKEEAEKRDFLPTLFGKIGRMSDVKVFVERGYGSGMGYTEDDYLARNPELVFLDSLEELYQKDTVIVIRTPEEDVIRRMRKGSTLFSMLHYETRPVRNRVIEETGIKTYSMDGLRDDEGNRLFVFFKGTSFSAVKVAMDELKKRHPHFSSPSRELLRVSLIGCGPVGQTAIRAFQKFSDAEFLEKGLPGMLITALPRAVVRDKKRMATILTMTDILVDATGRRDGSEIILQNTMLGYLPRHSIILDITADPYDTKADPPSVKALEGVPYGTMERYVIEENDPLYDEIPPFVDTTNRRLCISCNAWPGFDPERCMKRYESQLMPFLRILLERDPSNITETSDFPFERALARSTLEYFRAHS